MSSVTGGMVCLLIKVEVVPELPYPRLDGCFRLGACDFFLSAAIATHSPHARAPNIFARLVNFFLASVSSPVPVELVASNSTEKVFASDSCSQARNSSFEESLRYSCARFLSDARNLGDLARLCQ